MASFVPSRKKKRSVNERNCKKSHSNFENLHKEKFPDVSAQNIWNLKMCCHLVTASIPLTSSDFFYLQFFIPRLSRSSDLLTDFLQPKFDWGHVTFDKGQPCGQWSRPNRAEMDFLPKGPLLSSKHTWAQIFWGSSHCITSTFVWPSKSTVPELRFRYSKRERYT